MCCSLFLHNNTHKIQTIWNVTQEHNTIQFNTEIQTLYNVTQEYEHYILYNVTQKEIHTKQCNTGIQLYRM